VSVKARLTLAVVGLLAAATAILGSVVVSQTTDSMTQRIDDQIQDQLARLDGPGEDQQERAGQYQPAMRPPKIGGPDALTLLYSYVDGTGWVPSVPALEEQVASPPELPDPGSDALNALLDGPTDLSAESGDDASFRGAAVELSNGLVAVVVPTGNIEETVDHLLVTVLVTGLVVLVVGGAGCWWVIRRALRPVDHMIDTASAIAGGDLSQRIEHRDDRSELGRLGRALDEMLTQLEADSDERERAQARLRQFVADASHELRTPVAAVRGYAELYRAGGIQSGEPLDRAMGRIESESGRMGRLVEDLLLLTKLDQQQPLRTEPVDMSRVVEEAAADFEVIAPDRPLTVHAEPHSVVAGDAARLRQVVDNLVGNAYTHTPPHAAVEVRVRSRGGEVELSVTDSGPGIPVSEQARIFERFHRLDASRSRLTGGAGLGLSIVAAIADAHGGKVGVSSQPGDGATFTVRLPALVDGTGPVDLGERDRPSGSSATPPVVTPAP